MKNLYIQNGHLTDLALSMCIEALQNQEEDTLPPEILEHLQSCETCMQELYHFSAVSEKALSEYISVKEVALKPVKSIRSKSFSIKTYGLVASFILLCLMTFVLWFNLSNHTKTINNISRKTPIKIEEKIEDNSQLKEESKISDVKNLKDKSPTELQSDSSLQENPVLENLKSLKNTDKTNTPQISKTIIPIKPTFSNFDVPYIQQDEHGQVLEVLGSEAKIFSFANGSSIEIPAQAFVDTQGKFVEGKVEIQYREFHGAADIMASGIPMDFEENGKVYPLESAGMFEIKAQQNGEEVFLAKDKEIQVNLASNVAGDDFNFYYLNQESTIPSNLTIGGNPLTSSFRFRLTLFDKPRWEMLATKVPAKINPRKKEKQDMVTDLSPELSEKSEGFFKLNFDTDRFPNTQTFDDNFWKFAGWDAKENPLLEENKWVFSQKWQGIKTQALKNIKTPIVVKFQGHQANITAVDMSQNQELIATASADRTAKIWSKNGILLHNLVGHQKALRSVSFSEMNNLILTASEDKTAKLWTKEGKLLTTFKGHQKAISKAVFIPKTNLILTVSEDKTCKIWNPKGKLIQSFDTKTAVYDVVVSEDGKRILMAQENGAFLWNTEGKLLRQFGKQLYKSKDKSIKTVAFASREETFITGDDKGNIIFWNESGAIIHKIQDPNQPHTFAVSPLFGNIAVASKDEFKVKLWNLAGQYIKEFSNENQNDLREFVKKQNQVAIVKEDPNNYQGRITCLDISEDERFLLTGTNENEAYLWLFETPEDLYRINLQSKRANGTELQFSTIVEVNDIDKFKKSINIYEDDYMKSRETAAKKFQKEMNSVRSSGQSSYVRTFRIPTLGIFNWDKPFRVRKPIQLMADFEFEKSEFPKGHIALFLITGQNGNVVVNVPKSKWQNFEFYKQFSNQIIAVTPDNAIYSFSEKEFKQLNIRQIKKEGSYKFHLKQDAEITSLKQLKEKLNRREDI